MTAAMKSHRSKCVVLFGAVKAGKTAFLRRLLYDTYEETYAPTTEDFYEKVYVYQGYVFNLELIDTGSPFDFPAMRDLNISRVHVAMVMYDVMDEETMKVAAAILDIIEEKRGPENPLEIVFVGTKVDLYEGENETDIYGVLDAYLKTQPDRPCGHQITSCKNGTNVNRTMEIVLEKVLHLTPKDQLIEYVPKAVFCRGIVCCSKHSN